MRNRKRNSCRKRQVELVSQFISDPGVSFCNEEGLLMKTEIGISTLISLWLPTSFRTFRSRVESDFGHWLGKRNECVFVENYIKTRYGGSQTYGRLFIISGKSAAVSVRIPKSWTTAFTQMKYSVGKLFGRNPDLFRDFKSIINWWRISTRILTAIVFSDK